MKSWLTQRIRDLFAGAMTLSLPAVAETSEHTAGAAVAVANVSDQLTGFESPTSEALLLVIFILLVLAVIVHNPRAP